MATVDFVLAILRSLTYRPILFYNQLCCVASLVIMQCVSYSTLSSLYPRKRKNLEINYERSTTKSADKALYTLTDLLGPS